MDTNKLNLKTAAHTARVTSSGPLTDKLGSPHTIGGFDEYYGMTVPTSIITESEKKVPTPLVHLSAWEVAHGYTNRAPR